MCLNSKILKKWAANLFCAYKKETKKNSELDGAANLEKRNIHTRSLRQEILGSV